MQQVKLYRFMYEADDQGTPGVLITKGFRCSTLELPWRDNEPYYSCIPVGTYAMRVGKTRKALGGRRDLYVLEGVEERSGIFIHAGNWAGDTRQGYLTDSFGCPLLGEFLSNMRDQRALVQSRKTVEAFMTALAYQDAEIEVVNT